MICSTAGNDCRANDEDVIALLGRHCRAELSAQPLEGAQVLASVRAAWRTDAEKRDVGVVDGKRNVLGHVDSTASHDVRHEVLHPVLDDGAVPEPDQLQFGRVDVHANDRVTVSSETGKGHSAHVPDSEDADVH